MQVIALANEYACFFRADDPAIFLDETIFLNRPMIKINDVNQILSVKREKGKDSDSHEFVCEVKDFNKDKQFCRLMEQSKFYRWRPAEATPHGKELVFPNKLQLTYPFQKKAVIFEVG